MSFQKVFKRYELKHILTIDQKDKIIQAMMPYMKLDEYGKTTIRNIYFDTDTYLLIRRSIEKTNYKEKLRIRSYKQANENSLVFVEIKKKYNSVVYKRRITLNEEDAMKWIIEKKKPKETSQIAKEVQYFIDYYQTLHPKAFISYEREAYYALDNHDFRITFDQNILFRQEQMSLKENVYGQLILPKNQVLMEIKCSGSIPIWLVQVLSNEHLYKTTFSKYGMAYKTYIYPKIEKINKLVEVVI